MWLISASSERQLTKQRSSRAAVPGSWSTELKDRGIRVNVVSPAWIETPGGTSAFGDEETAVIAFLASEQSSFVVGANVCVDDGTNQI